MNWQGYITVEPAICHGRAGIKGMRIMVSVVHAGLREKMDLC